FKMAQTYDDHGNSNPLCGIRHIPKDEVLQMPVTALPSVGTEEARALLERHEIRTILDFMRYYVHTHHRGIDDTIAALKADGISVQDA
ncbi:hypothetical protein PFISCL1PPCAC_17087, partial [Pristionchus fissidentatus]